MIKVLVPSDYDNRRFVVDFLGKYGLEWLKTISDKNKPTPTGFCTFFPASIPGKFYCYFHDDTEPKVIAEMILRYG